MVLSSLVSFVPPSSVPTEVGTPSPAGGEGKSVATIAYSGKVATLVTEENGEIKAGDRLTVSKTLPGYAMKMTESGQSLGIALESSAAGTDKILAFVNLGYQRIDVAQASCGQALDGSAASIGDSAASSGRTTPTPDDTRSADDRRITCNRIVYDRDIDMSGMSLLNVKAIAGISGKWSISEDGTITAKQLCLEEVCITKTELKKLLELTGVSGTPSSNSSDRTPAFSPEGSAAGVGEGEGGGEPQPLDESQGEVAGESIESQETGSSEEEDPVEPSPGPEENGINGDKGSKGGETEPAEEGGGSGE